METEPKYYDGFPVRERHVETERERDLQCVNKSLIRQISERDAEIRGINAAYEVLEKENDALREQVTNLTKANEFLFKLLSELTIVSDKVSELNRDLKKRNEKLRGILVDDLKRKVPDKIADFMV